MAKTNGTPLQKSLYGLGVLLFGMLSNPLKAQKPSELEQIQRNPPALKDQRPEIPDELNQLVSQLLHPNPSQREQALALAHPTEAILLPKTTSTSATTPIKQKQVILPDVHRDLSLPTWLIFCKEKSFSEKAHEIWAAKPTVYGEL